MKKSTMCFIGAGAALVLGFVVQSIGFATASTEAELATRAAGGNFLWIVGGAVVIAIVGIVLKVKGEE